MPLDVARAHDHGCARAGPRRHSKDSPGPCAQSATDRQSIGDGNHLVTVPRNRGHIHILALILYR